VPFVNHYVYVLYRIFLENKLKAGGWGENSSSTVLASVKRQKEKPPQHIRAKFASSKNVYRRFLGAIPALEIKYVVAFAQVVFKVECF
jgi:hypothetical protein